MRSEREVFNEIAELCNSSGYIHALAWISFQDNMLMYGDEVTDEDFARFFNPHRLIRTELTTLIGLVLRHEINFSLPDEDTVGTYVTKTYDLLEELHRSMFDWSPENLKEDTRPNPELLSRGSFLREPMFYSGESAYSFQFRDLAVSKYKADDPWLEENKGFTIKEARDVARTIQTILNDKLATAVEQAAEQKEAGKSWTLLPGFTFSVDELTAAVSIPEPRIRAVLNAFSAGDTERNDAFNSMHDFNVVTASPLIRRDNDSFILLEQYELLQCLYEGPFYWMGGDQKYVSTAMKNRGDFTESFTRQRLQDVFGKKAVLTNITAYRTKAEAITEIDTLVVFGNRAIVVQAKSKRLTLESKRGNDRSIHDDFRKSVQDAYDQGLQSAAALQTPNLIFRDSSGNPINIESPFKQIYILCLVSDHYPALSFQSRQFLKYRSDEIVAPPLVLDIFALDTMAEFLTSPLQFLSYVNRRTLYHEKIAASHELVVLAFHLQHNLWIDPSHAPRG